MQTQPTIVPIPPEQLGRRLDNFLLKELKGVPKSHLYRLLRTGQIRVNKKRCKPDYRLQADDHVRLPPLRLGEPLTPPKPKATTVALLNTRILYEDAGLLILNKPAGMAVHGGSGISLGVIEILRQARPKARYLELAHRLDRDTSGCLIVAKKSSTLKELHEMFRQGRIHKVYQALICGVWPDTVWRIDAPLRKNQLRSGERIVKVAADGKAALAEFRILARYERATLLEVTLHTGRTHQIRVHAAHVGHPLGGDSKYGDVEFNRWLQRQGHPRLWLHAAELHLTLPEQVPLRIQAPLDQDWIAGLACLGG